MSSNQNAAGLLPSESRVLTERSVKPEEEHIIKGIKEMYSCAPTETTFNIYTSDGVFHDPIGIATGPDSIKAQFVGLAKLFPKAELPKFRLLQTPSNLPPNTIVIDQDVAYFRDPKASSPTKILNSLLVLYTSGDSPVKVTKHEENWNHEKTSTSEDGFFGMINEQRKKLTAKITDAAVGK